MKNFAICGAAGYIAPRHLKAIKDTGNNLIAALDPHDSVGIMDSYFPNSDFFTNFERFERHLEKLSLFGDTKIDYLTVCSPNFLHDTHIRLGLNIGADVICEKPLVLNPFNLDLLQKVEQQTGKRVYTIMQLRYHSALIDLKSKIDSENDKTFEVKLKYITPRGKWYHYSWKGDEEKSGGIATNIGIHLFDLLIWLFGDVIKSELKIKQNDKMAGSLQLKKANVEWFLSIDKNDLPESALNSARPSFRSLSINGNEIEFSEGFTDLHTKVYQEIFNGNGLGIEDARKSIELVYQIRNTK